MRPASSSGRLREGEPGRRWNRDVPVIMVSSRGEPVDRVRGFARGCDDYVVNPCVSVFPRMGSGIPRGAGIDSFVSVARSSAS
jgi:PleD family two-component response regulator